MTIDYRLTSALVKLTEKLTELVEVRIEKEKS